MNIDTIAYSNEFCKNCGTNSPRETTKSGNDDTGVVTTVYCKGCKKFNRIETDSSGSIVAEQYDL